MPSLDDFNWAAAAERTCCLELAEQGYTGTIPTEIGLLTKYTQGINLNGNRLHGPIPTEVGLLEQMQYELDLSSNQLTGPIPSELAKTVMKNDDGL